MQLLVIPGSLREGSYNRALARAVPQCVPDGVEVVTTDLVGIPPLNEDQEQELGTTGPVAALRQAVTEADVVLFCTPEYNQSIPGVVKNAVDWLSRALPEKPLQGKPVGVIGAAPGPWGTRMSQKELRHVLGVVGAVVMLTPNLWIRHAGEAFTDGELTDENHRAQLTKVLASLKEWAGRFADG